MWIPSLKVARRQTVLAAVALCLPVWAAAAETAAAPADAQSAVWTPKELTFVFMGFTARYSCDGLRDKIRRVLGELGARSDFTVDYHGCSSPFGKPDPFPGVRIRMQVLEPAGASDKSADVVGAHWQRVDLHLDRDPVWEASDCELLEQIKQKILPLFATRQVDFASNCVPHQANLGTRLAAELLFPDPKGDKTVASK
ncbi:MAG TPA: hypothetical protein VEC59_00880 [Steroidobacteraceae bacterium]|nr:hypothetical protein [Steroidobacteraceae bacterium]